MLTLLIHLLNLPFIYVCLFYILIIISFFVSLFIKFQSIQFQTILFTRYANTCEKLQLMQSTKGHTKLTHRWGFYTEKYLK